MIIFINFQLYKEKIYFIITREKRRKKLSNNVSQFIKF